MKPWSKLLDTLQAVPVFAKIMGIAMGLTLFYGIGTYWQIHASERQTIRHEQRNAHTPAELAVIEEHLQRETGTLTRRLARVMSVMAIAGMLLAWLLTRILTHPLDELLRLTRRVQHGDLSARAPVHANDEIGDLAAAFNEMTAALEEKEAARRELQRRAISAAEEERKRLARDLHDQTGQQLTALIAGLSALECGAGNPRVAGLRELAEDTLQDVHAVSVALRPSSLDDLGLVAALRKHLDTLAGQFNAKMDLQVVGLDNTRLPADLELTLYRVAQEALTNSLRHGEAQTINLLLQRRDGHVLLVVEDDGRGFDAARPRPDARLGLLGIEERAALLGGTLRVESRPGAGTSLFVEIPCRESAS